MWQKYAVQVGKKKSSSTHPGMSLPSLVSLLVFPLLSSLSISWWSLPYSLACSFLFSVSIPASFSDITFSLKIGSESYFYPLSRDLSSQTPTGCRNKFKTNPGEERKKRKKRSWLRPRFRFYTNLLLGQVRCFGPHPTRGILTWLSLNTT